MEKSPERVDMENVAENRNQESIWTERQGNENYGGKGLASGTSQFVHVIGHFQGDLIEKNEVEGTCSIHGEHQMATGRKT